MRLLLIRHGQTPANVRGQLDTDAPGPGLTELGRIQADTLPRTLDGRSIDLVFASTLVRTQLTATPLAATRGLTIDVRAGVREIEAGDFERRSDPESVEHYVDTIVSWVRGDLGRTMPGAPDGTAFFERYDQTIAAVEATGADTAVVVSHGAAIRTWSGSRAGNLDADFIATNHLENTGVVELEGSMRTGWDALSWAGRPLHDLVQ